MLGEPLFAGESGIDQLVEIIKVLGTPTQDQVLKMNPKAEEYKFPNIKPLPWTKVLKKREGIWKKINACEIGFQTQS